MERSEQAGKNVGRIESRGDPDVTGDALRKGVLAFIESSAGERKADGFHDLDGECLLFAGHELTVERQRRRALLGLDRLPNQRRQTLRERPEQGIDIPGRDSGAELIDQCIVRIEVQGLPEQQALVANELQHFLEMRREDVEASLLARLRPLRLGARGGARQTGDQ